MYLSHNITNLLVEIALAKQKLEIFYSQNKDKISQQIYNNDAHSLSLIANEIGLEINVNDAAKLLKGESLESDDVRAQLVTNIIRTHNLSVGLSENDSITIDRNAMLNINKSIAHNTIEEWKIKFRSQNESSSLLFDDLRTVIKPEFRKVDANTEINNIIQEYKDNTSSPRFYKIAVYIYRLLELHPFASYNKYTILFIGQLMLNKYLTPDRRLVNLTTLFVEKDVEIVKSFRLTAEDKRQVAWIELFLNIILENLQEACKDLKTTTKNKQKATDQPFLDLNKRQLKILNYLQNIPTVKREDYVEMMRVSAMTAYRDLNDLLEKNLLKTIGQGRGTKYMLSS